MMAPIIDASLSRARTVISILVLLLLSGGFSYVNIPKESSPDIDIPQIYVSAYLEGISPEDSERLIIRPLEQELASIEGVKEMKATGYQGGGYVLLEFLAGFDKKKALDDVQKAVDQARPELPADVDDAPSVKVVCGDGGGARTTSGEHERVVRLQTHGPRQGRQRIFYLVCHGDVGGCREASKGARCRDGASGRRYDGRAVQRRWS